MLEGQVDKAFEKALQTVELQPTGGLAQRLGQAVGRVAEDVAQTLHLQVADRKGKAQLGQTPRRLQAGQTEALAIQIAVQHQLQLRQRHRAPGVGIDAVAAQGRRHQVRQCAFAARPIFENSVQASTGPRTTGEGVETAARLAGIRHDQAIAVRRFHMHARR